MSFVKEVCFVCQSSENVVVEMPRSKDKFDKWMMILNVNNDKITHIQRRKICLAHFKTEYHSVLKDPHAKRSRLWDPLPVQDQAEEIADYDQGTNNNNKRSLSPSVPSSSFQFTNKKPVNTDLILKMKNDEIMDLTKQVSALKMQNEGLQKQNNNMSSQLKSYHNVPHQTKTFIDVLLSSNLKGKRYNKEQKHICQTLYYKNPSYYQFLHETLQHCLPSKTSLLRWQTFKMLSLGIVPEIINYLKDIRESLSKESSKLVLICDEMDGRKGLAYDERRDCIIGFQYLYQPSTKLAKKFLTFMVRGLDGAIGNLIIANYATSTGINGEELAVLIPMIVRMLADIQYQIVIVNMDQSGVNRKAFTILEATEDHPYFFVEGMKVYATFDVPHLFKSLRTTFLEHKMESVGGKIAGDLVKTAYLLDKKATIRLFPKLTDNHFFYDTFMKMRVNLAVQVVSNTVAQGLRKMTDNGLLKKDKTLHSTIIFIQNMNNLFDLLNGSTNNNDKNQLKNGVSARNVNMLKMLSTYVASLRKTDAGSVYWIKGLVQTVHGIILYFDEAAEKNNDFVLYTKNINQDPLENLFGLVRSRGGSNRNPDLINFLRLISQIMTSKLLIECKNTNCEFNESAIVKVLDLEKYCLPKDESPVMLF